MLTAYSGHDFMGHTVKSHHYVVHLSCIQCCISLILSKTEEKIIKNKKLSVRMLMFAGNVKESIIKLKFNQARGLHGMVLVVCLPVREATAAVKRARVQV